MDFIQDIQYFITNNIVASITGATAILATFSAGITNLSIYAMCKTYAIPFRLTFTNIRDAYDLLMKLFVVVLAVVFPLLYAFGGLSKMHVWGIIVLPLALSLTTGILYVIPDNRLQGLKSVANNNVRHRAIRMIMNKKMWTILAIFVIIGTILWAFLIQGNPSTNPVGDVFLCVVKTICILYLIVPLAKILIHIVLRALGEHDDFFIATINKKSYLVVMRHDKDTWICLPCEVIETANGTNGTIPYTYPPEHGHAPSGSCPLVRK